MDGWGDQAEATTTGPWDKPVAEALIVPRERECPGRAGLCGLPLAAGEVLCPACSAGYPLPPVPSASLRRQIQPPATPECATCSRPVPRVGETCRWCQGRAALEASPRLQAAIDVRVFPECPGNGGMCGAPLPPGETRCAECRQAHGETAAPAPRWERCRGQGGACGRLVLPGRGQCFECRQAAKVSRIMSFPVGGPSTS
jgi:hypothetical protein